MKKIRFAAILTAAALLLTSCSSSEEIAYDPTVDETTTTTVTAATEAKEEVTTTASTTKAETTTAETTTEVTTEETAVTTTTTAETTTTAVTTWTEQAANKVMYVNTNGIYSRKYAIQGSATVKQYKVNDKVTVVALTNTDYYKLNDGSFIHKDYLSASEVVITTTTAATTTPAETVSVSSDIESLINSAPLHPMKTNEPDVDAMASDILSQITNSSMTTYQKVKAVYDYIIQTCKYEGGWMVSTDVNYCTMLDYFIVMKACTIMMKHEGVCENYSSLFLVLTRAIGLETYLGFGQVATKSGGTTGHTWAIMKLNGEYYIFDPQVEQSNLVNGQIRYRYFCRSESSAAGTYTYTDSDFTEQLASYSGITFVGNNPRDHAIQLFGNFVVDTDEKPWTGIYM